MMRAYELSAGRLSAGIPIDPDGTIHVGEEGRGRKLVRVPIPATAVVEGGRLMSVAHSLIARGRLMATPDEVVALVLVRDPVVRQRISPWREIAVGIGADGGREYLAVLPAGEAVEFIRLYGAPMIERVACDAAGCVVASDPVAEAQSVAAALRMSAALGDGL